MSRKFDVNTGNLKNIADDYQKICNRLENYSNSMQSICNQMYSYSYGNVRNSLSNVIQKNDRNIRKMRQMGNSLSSIAGQYEQTENRIVNHSNLSGKTSIGSIVDIITDDNRIPDIINPIPGIIDRIDDIVGPDAVIPEPIWKIGINDWLDIVPIMPTVIGMPMMPLVTLIGLHKLFEVKEGAEKKVEGNVSYKDWTSKNGVASAAFLTAGGAAGLEQWRAYAEGSAAVLTGKVEKEGKYAAGSAEASFLKVEGEASIGVSNSYSEKDGEGEVSTIGAKASVSANVLTGEAEGRLGLEDMNVHGGAEGSLVGAGAEAEAGITYGANGEFKAKAGAEAEAYLAKGEVKGGFTIFGIDIEVGAEGMIGVQAEAEVEAGLDGFGFDLGLGPIGLDVAIDWSDFDLTFWD